jgi:hypothetical protein
MAYSSFCLENVKVSGKRDMFSLLYRRHEKVNVSLVGGAGKGKRGIDHGRKRDYGDY